MNRTRRWIPAIAGMTIFLASSAHAQGFLPPTAKSTSTVDDTSSLRPLRVGDEVPGTLTVIDETGKRRSLLSYKSYLEVLVVTFYSAPCELKPSAWPPFRRLDERYKEWRVSFVAVNTSAPEKRSEIEALLRREKIGWPTVQDDQRAAVNLLVVTGTPEVVVIDESAVVRYRGPIDFVPEALNAIISHVDPVVHREPPMTGACAL